MKKVLAPDILTPEILRLPKRELSEGAKRTIGYLGIKTKDLSPSELLERRKMLEMAGNSTEDRYYGAWMELEAALPGFFSVDDSRPITQPVDANQTLADGIHTFSALYNRTKVCTAEELMSKCTDELHFKQLVYGLRAGMVSSLAPFFSTPDIHTELTHSIVRRKWDTMTQDTVELLSNQGELIRKQIFELQRLYARSNTGFSKEFIRALKGSLTGLEAEHTLLGALWSSNLNVAPEDAIIAVPASARVDYGFNNIPKADIILYFHDMKFGVSVRRTAAAQSPTNKLESEPTDPRIFSWYGDRDLRLPYVKMNDPDDMQYAPEFSGYLREALMVRRQIIDTMARESVN